MKKVATFFVVFLMVLPSTINAGEYQSIESITSAARVHVKTQTRLMPYQSLEITAVQIDPRLHLRQCQHKLQTFSPTYQRKGRQTTVGVSCNLPKAWKIYVPVQVLLKTPVLVTSRQLNPGDIITEDDINTQQQSVSHLNYGYYDRAHKILGQHVKRMISAGTVLTPQMLKAAQLIKRGQMITISARLGGINISAQGKALMDGASGDTIRVKNTTSGKIIEGRVEKNGTVLINI
ncbi:MAG: flagellar basal body P-ring formation protein FlgA [Pseudomonadales bacterium]|nr:flagellar basal body P-ring formation protein FlgA [Pseudomonadales bacterium]